ncbi:MAG: T9SS type A sorting domain-containing protein [Bacteroidia bacterium]
MAFILTAMLFSVSANAQIVYTDVIPDSTMNCIGSGLSCTKNYNLDLNNDAITDFVLTAFRVAPLQIGLDKYSNVTASPLNGNAVKDTLVNTNHVSIPLQFNAVIDSNLLLQQSWQTLGSHSLKEGLYGGGLAFDTVWGLWDSLSDYYLGLRLEQSGQTHYGWVRLRVDVPSTYASIIVRDYAYNSIPNQPILAGQTVTTGISENSFASTINLFPNPATNHLTIDLGSKNEKVEVTIADISGKVIYSTVATDAQMIEVYTDEFIAEIYVVQIHSAHFMATKKLVIGK